SRVPVAKRCGARGVDANDAARPGRDPNVGLAIAEQWEAFHAAAVRQRDADNTARRPARKPAIRADPDVAARIRQKTVDLFVGRQTIDVPEGPAESEESGIARSEPHAAIGFRDRNHRCVRHHVWWNHSLEAAAVEADDAVAVSADQNAAATLG